jgi:hypothetical protein
MQEYIILNGLPFFVDDPQPPKQTEIGSGIQRTLSGIAKKDVICKKRKWTYSFILNSISLLRLYKIYDSNSEITLIDQYGETFTIIHDGEWQPNREGTENDKEIFTVIMNFEEI